VKFTPCVGQEETASSTQGSRVTCFSHSSCEASSPLMHKTSPYSQDFLNTTLPTCLLLRYLVCFRGVHLEFALLVRSCFRPARCSILPRTLSCTISCASCMALFQAFPDLALTTYPLLPYLARSLFGPPALYGPPAYNSTQSLILAGTLSYIDSCVSCMAMPHSFADPPDA
jgi:hypothetical protein